MNIKRLLTLALVALAVVAALAVLIPDHETGDLGGTSWTLVAYGPKDAPIPAEAPATIEFENNGRMDGWTGCNRFFANFRAKDGRLSFVDDGLARTLAECDPATAEGAQDAFFHQWLGGVIRYAQRADRLILNLEDGQIAEYVPAP
ncbi:MAG: META domain-containing protein [Anaerolineae bacterium]|nr:META domain-containing protein [Anaerolineae bacterium]